MKSSASHQRLILSILSGAYTPLDVRDFVQLCYSLAVPLIRKKIVSGRLNLSIMRLKESDVVYDCLADLFRRDGQGRFIDIEAYFKRQSATPEVDGKPVNEELFMTLRRLVFQNVNKNIIRLYSEVDPVLGKVLRNIKLAVEKTGLFREEDRFGETVLVAAGADALSSQAPIPFDIAEQLFSRTVLIHDNVIVMVNKLHRLLIAQQEYQRVLPLVQTALMVKKVYLLGWEEQEEMSFQPDTALRNQELAALARQVCVALGDRLRKSYVEKGKLTEEMFRTYLLALQDILLGEFGVQLNGDSSYFERLKQYLPDLTKRSYVKDHRKILEYLAKTGKSLMRKELKAE